MHWRDPNLVTEERIRGCKSARFIANVRHNSKADRQTEKGERQKIATEKEKFIITKVATIKTQRQSNKHPLLIGS